MVRTATIAPSTKATEAVLQVGGEALVEMDPSRKFLVQDFTPLSESVLWDLLKNYYKKMALKAWADNHVPMFVTSNSRFAKSYAKTVFAFLKDWYRSPGADRTRPVYILEVGAGHGRFSFLFLRHLLRTRPLWKSCNLPDRPFVYVFSDVVQANIEFCHQHQFLQEFIQDGWLDFALFDGNETSDFDRRIHMQIKDDIIPAGSCMVVVCNYVLDSLLTDGYQICIENGNRYYARSRIAIYSSREEPDITDPDLIPRMSVMWDWQKFEFPITDASCNEQQHQSPMVDGRVLENCNPLEFLEPEVSDSDFLKSLVVKKKEELRNYLKRRKSIETGEEEAAKNVSTGQPLAPCPDYVKNDPKIQFLLQHYGQQTEDLPGYSVMSFVLPFGAFKLFEYLNHYSNNNLLVLIGDKGYSDVDEFKGDRAPHIAIHGSISFMVNLHSIKQYFTAAGGFYACTPYKDTFQVTFCFSFNSLGPQAFGETMSHLVEEAEDLPPDSLIAWQRTTEENAASQNAPSLKTLMSLLRYSAHDPEVFFNFRKELVAQCVAPFLGPRGESDLQKDLERVFEHWYKLHDSEDIPDVLAQLSMRTGRLDRALFFFQKSLDLSPKSRHVSTLANMASCHRAMGRLDEALETIKTALTEYPDFKPALDLKMQIEMCMNRISLGLIGCGSYIREEAFHSLAVDGRILVRGVFTFQRSDADVLINQLKLGDECTIYSGSSGLAQLLNRPDIDACIVDVHPGVFASIASKVWAAGKHLFSRSPISLSSQTAYQTIQKFIVLDKFPPGMVAQFPNRLLWNVATSAEYEEAFVEKQRSWYNYIKHLLIQMVLCLTSAALANDLLQGIAALRVILNAELVAIGAALSKSSNALSGWFRLKKLVDSTHHHRQSPEEIVGAFSCFRHSSDKSAQIDLQCEKGLIKLKRLFSSWKVIMKFDTSMKPSRDKAFLISGVSESHDRWLQKLFSYKSLSIPSTTSTRTPNSEEDLEPSETSEPEPATGIIGKIHSSVYTALTDSAVVEAIILSVKNRGCPMELGVARTSNGNTKERKQER